MKIETVRFGTLDVDDADAISFPNGVIGFPGERMFVLIRQSESSAIGWLQSTKTSWLALPVVSLDALAMDCDDLMTPERLESAGIEDIDEVAMMVVLNPTGPIGPTVNLVAPIVVNVMTRTGAQIFIEGTRHSTQEKLVLRPKTSPKAKAAEAHASRQMPHPALEATAP